MFAAGDVRRGSAKRVASAVGEGATTIPLVHRYLGGFAVPKTPARLGGQGVSLPQPYEIRVRGWLGDPIRSAFPALRAQVDSGDTVLTGLLADQAALYGVLAEAEALGLELIEVRRLASGEPQAPPS